MSYKILSLDGGGSWALIQARVLMDIYGDIRGHALLRQFDMAIANSGGSLVLACLCNDMKISEIISIFKTKEQRTQVFSSLTFREKFKWRNIASLFTRDLGPRYSMERKVKGIVNVLKQGDHLFREGLVKKPIVETLLDELPEIIGKKELQLLIAGFDYFRERASFFRSNPDSQTDKFNDGRFFQVSLAHAIHSSSNAPVNYFDAPAEIQVHIRNTADTRRTWYWDGGVSGFNNPVLAGLTEAMTNNKLPLSDYCILSIGTGTGSRTVLTDYKYSTDPVTKAIYDINKDNPLTLTDVSAGFVQDIKKLAKSILGDPPDSATFITYSILDPALNNTARLVRINPCIRAEKDKTGFYDIPVVYKNMPGGREKFSQLMEMDMDAVEDWQIELIDDLCDKFLVTDGSPCLTNQLIRGDVNGQYFLGQPFYNDAKDRWGDLM